MKKLLIYFIVLFVHIHVAFASQNQTGTASRDTIKLLAIGNSFSEDALENYLYDLAKAANRVIIIGNLYIGGAPLDLHVKNAQENNKNYSYRKIDLNGIKTTTEKISLEEAFADENWNHVSLQQASPVSGNFSVIMQSLPTLFNYVQTKMSPSVKIVYHQTWAYQHDSTHDGFANYGHQQKNMFDSIASATQKIQESHIFTFVVPSGTAIQNARTSSMGDTFTRDGYHLELNYGRFIAACTWYEKIFGLDVRKNKYKPEQITQLQAKIAKESAHRAVKKPFKISKIKL